MWVGPVEVARPVEPCHAYYAAVRNILNMISGHVMRVNMKCEFCNVF